MTSLAHWLSLFLEDGDVFEIRGLDVGRPGAKVCGFVRADRVAAMAGAIADLATRAGGVYFTPQTLDPNVLTRSPHHLAEVRRRSDGYVPKPTHDEDVTARRYLILDVDPVRPAEAKKQSATDREKEAAWCVADAVRMYLALNGWKLPLIVDSGNGFHLYYQLPEALPGGPVDSQTDPLATLLRTLKAKFDTPAATIDQTVFNAARIMKIPGTPSRKGRPTKDRPHRTSKVLEVPSDWK